MVDQGSNVLVRLPSGWRIAKDPEGRAYYWNVDTNQTQWEPPPEETEGGNTIEMTGVEEITVVEMETAIMCRSDLAHYFYCHQRLALLGIKRASLKGDLTAIP